MLSQELLDHWFSYRAPTPEQVTAYKEIREAAKKYAETVNKHVPDCDDKTIAIRKIHDSVMTANLAIACHAEPEKNLQPPLQNTIIHN